MTKMKKKEPFVFRRCAICKVYFENYTQASVHLGLTHSDSIKSSSLKQKEGTLDLIESHKYSEVIICLEKLSPQKISEYNNHKDSIEKTKFKKTLKKGKIVTSGSDGCVEIKLDTLKASEIETLISNLYNKPYVSSKDKDLTSSPSVRRSRRKIKQRFPKGYEKMRELNSEYEEMTDDNRISPPTKRRCLKHEEYYYDPNKSLVSSDEDSSSNIKDSSDDEDYLVTRGGKRVIRKSTEQANASWDDARCRLCEKKFNLSNEYLKHMKSEHLTENKTYKCNKEYFHPRNFNNHVDEHAKPPKPLQIQKRRKLKSPDDGRFKCDICGKNLRSQCYLELHRKMHENSPFQCKFLGCGKKFSRNSTLKRHAVLHVARPCFKCLHCPADYTTRFGLRRHVQRCHSEGTSNPKSFMRKEKRYRLKNINDLVSDFLKTKNEEDSKDDSRFEVESIHLTDQIITKDNENDNHIKGEILIPSASPNILRSRSSSPFHINDELSKVNEFTSSFAAFELIKLDSVVQKLQEENPELANTVVGYRPYTYNTKNPKKIQEFKCQLCSWVGLRAYLLKNHLERNHKETSFNIFEPTYSSNSKYPLGIELICGTCGYPSKSSEDLSNHMSTAHVVQKKFPCSFCQLRFYTKNRKDRHVKEIHETEKKFSCDKCKAKFVTWQSRDKHMTKQHDPNNTNGFRCPTCSKVLASKSSFTEHQKSHLEKRPLYICKLCNQNCTTEYSLKRHIQYVHMRVKNPYNEKMKAKKLAFAKMSNCSPSSTATKVNDKSNLQDADNNCKNDDDEILGF